MSHLKLTKSPPGTEKNWILVTGGAGYIGSHVSRQLHEAGYRIVIVDNLSNGFPDNLLPGQTFIEGDIGDERFLDRLFSRYAFQSIFHLAGSTIVPESVRDPVKYYESNTSLTLKLVNRAARARLSHFVFSSSAAVYGENLRPSLAESLPPNPTNPHSRSKWMSECMIRDTAFANPGLRFVILRYFNVAGADPNLRMGLRSARANSLMKVASEAVVGKRNYVTIFGTDYPTCDGTGVRDYIHVEDVASAHLAAIRYLEAKGPSVLLNCGYGFGFSVREVLREFRRHYPGLRVVEGPRRPGDLPRLVADVGCIHETLDWQPTHISLAEIVDSAVAWERRLADPDIHVRAL